MIYSSVETTSIIAHLTHLSSFYRKETQSNLSKVITKSIQIPKRPKETPPKMTNKAFVAVFVLLVIITAVLIIAAALFIKRRKRRNGKPKDPESANIGREHVEFANNIELRNMQAPRSQILKTRRSLDITRQEFAPPRSGTQFQTSTNSRPVPRSSLEQWRRRGFELSTSAPPVIPEEGNTGQESQNPRQSRGSATPIADSFLRQSRIGVATTTPSSELVRPGLSLNTQPHQTTSPYVEPTSRPKLSVDTQTPGHAKAESSARRGSKFQEHLQSPENQWHDIELSPPPPRQSMQSNGSSWRDSFQSDRLPASWGKAVN